MNKLGLSVTPKPHIFEDHTIDSMQDINGLGDKTEDFIELYQKYGAHQDRLIQFLRGYTQKHESQHKAEHRASHPKVQEVKEKMREKRKLCAKIYASEERTEEKKRCR